MPSNLDRPISTAPDATSAETPNARMFALVGGFNKLVSVATLLSLITKNTVGLSNVNNTSDADKPLSTAAIAALNNLSTALNNHLTATNPHNVTKGTIGLGNVDNTSDLNKPLSNAVSTALSQINTKITVDGQTDNIGVIVGTLLNRLNNLVNDVQVNDGSTPIGTHVENLLTTIGSFDASIIQGILASISSLNTLTSSHSTQLVTLTTNTTVGDGTSPIKTVVEGILTDISGILTSLSTVNFNLTTHNNTLITHGNAITALQNRVTAVENELANLVIPPAADPFDGLPVIPMPIALSPINTAHAGGNTLGFTTLVPKHMVIKDISVNGTTAVAAGESFTMDVTIDGVSIFNAPILVDAGQSETTTGTWSFADNLYSGSFGVEKLKSVPAGSRLTGTIITGGGLMNPVMWLEWFYAMPADAYKPYAGGNYY